MMEFTDGTAGADARCAGPVRRPDAPVGRPAIVRIPALSNLRLIARPQLVPADLTYDSNVKI